MPKNIEAAKLIVPIWDAANPRASIEKLQVYAEAQAQNAIGWYYAKKERKSVGSWLFRIGAILCTGLGGIVPIIVSATVTNSTDQLRLNMFGYVAVGVAGICLALDRFTGSSSAWMRYIATALRIESLLEEFRHECLKLHSSWAGATTDAATTATFLDRIKVFCLAVRAEVEKETQAWIVEFRSNLAQLEKESKEALDQVRAQAKTESEAVAKEQAAVELAQKPGAIQIVVKSATAVAGGFSVELDGASIATNITGKEFGIDSVKPGIHTVGVVIPSGTPPLRSSRAVKVPSGDVVQAVFEL